MQYTVQRPIARPVVTCGMIRIRVVGIDFRASGCCQTQYIDVYAVCDGAEKLAEVEAIF